MIELVFVDGSRTKVPDVLADRVVGKDADGDILVPLDADLLPNYFIPLTPCCFRDGKGSASGVVCRNCYRSVDPKFGGSEAIAVKVGALDSNALLAEIRTLATTLLDVEQIDGAEHAQEIGEELARKIVALDQHVSSYYGTLPEAWDEHQW